jgi:hypothetical protein
LDECWISATSIASLYTCGPLVVLVRILVL